MGRRNVRSFAPRVGVLAVVTLALILPSIAFASIELGFNGAGVWPRIATANSQRWFRFHITWSENELWYLVFDGEGVRFRFDLNGDGWRDWSMRIDMRYPYVAGLAPGESPGSVGVVVNSLGTRDIMVTIGPFAAAIYEPRVGITSSCFRPNTIGVVGGPADYQYTFYGRWTHWSEGGEPTTDEVSGWYATLPDNDDALQWYAGPANGIDPLSVDPANPANPVGPDNGSSSSRYIFRVRYQTNVTTTNGGWAQQMRCRWMGWDSLGVPPDESSSMVDLDRATYDFTAQRFSNWGYTGGDVDSWLLHPGSDSFADRQGYQDNWHDGAVLLIIDEDYDHPHWMIPEDPSDTDPTDGIIYRYEILPTDYQNWIDTVFLFPQDPTFQDAWDGYSSGMLGRPVSNNYVTFYRGGHKYEFWCTDDIKPVAWWGQGNVAWVQIGRPGLEGRIALVEGNVFARSNDFLNQKIVPLYKDNSRPPIELEPVYSTPGDPAQRIPLLPTATTYQRFDDHNVSGGGYGYPFNSQDPNQYPKCDPVLSAHPFFPLRDATPTDPTAPDPMANMSDTWPGFMRPGVGTTSIGPHAYNSLPYPFNPLADNGEPWPAVAPLDPSGAVEAGWIGTNFAVYPGPGSTNVGPAPTRFCNDGTILPNYVNITPDTDPNPYVGGKWTDSATYTFRIVYWQSDNVAPDAIRLWIRRNDPGGTPGTWRAYTMQKVYPGDNDYTDGCVFYYRLSAAQLPGGGGPGDYNYFFTASDGTNTAVFPNRPDRYQQPGGGTWDDPGDIGVVPDASGNGPDYYWFRVNSPPQLSDQQVTPTVGREGDNFTFEVTYTDTDEQVLSDYRLHGVGQPQGHGDRVFRSFIHLDLFGNELGTCTVRRILSNPGENYRFRYQTERADASGNRYYPDNSLVGLEVQLPTSRDAKYQITANTRDSITLAAIHDDTLANMVLPVGASFTIADWFVGTMEQVNTSDTDYTDGALFRFETATRVVLQPGVHRYYFEFWDDWGSWLFRDDPNVRVEGEPVYLPGSRWFVGPEVIGNTAPQLTDFRFVPKSGTGGYDGTTATEFTFYVTYVDAENDPPSLIRVGVDLETPGQRDDPALILDMTPRDPNDRVYRDGAVFESQPVRLGQGNYVIRAQCSDGALTYPWPGWPDPAPGDGKLRFAGPPDPDTGDPTDYADGPNVGPNTPPVLLYPTDDDGSDPNNPPGLEPNEGTSQTTFTYTVIYKDTDQFAGVAGNPPEYVQVYIDNQPYDMQPVDPNDQDYTDGATYQFSISGLVAGDPHTYFFVASDGVDRARLPDMPGVNDGPVVDEPPGEPQQLLAKDTPDDNGNSIDLTWNASLDDGGGANDVAKYRVYRATTSGGYSAQWLAEVPATGAATYTYTDNATNSGAGNEPQDGVDYYYVVTAVDNGDRESPYSNEAGPVRALDNIAPRPPSGLTVTNPGLGGILQLAWQLSPDDPDSTAPDSAGDVTEYHIYRSTDGTSWPSSPTLTAPAGTTTFDDATVQDGQDYWYKVRAYDGTQESADSNVVGPRQSSDDNPPQITSEQPAPNALDVPPNTNISFEVIDTGAGVDENSLALTVQMRERGSNTWQDVAGQLTLDTGQLPRRLGVVFDPDADLPYYATVRVSVDVQDRRTPNPNAASETWRFTISGPVTYRVAGHIRTSEGAGLPGVLVQVGPFKDTTDNTGYYEVTGLAPGRYEVVPTLADWAFTPRSKVVDVQTDQLGVDFTAVPGYDIRGRITTTDGRGLGGVLVSAGAYTATTNNRGDYTLADLPAGTYTVVPTLTGYVFTPPSRDVQLVDRNVGGQNFTAEPVTYSLSGRIATAQGDPVAGVRVSAYDQGGRKVAEVQTGAPGTYMFDSLPPGQYTVRPQLAGWAFEPEEIQVNLAGDVTGVDFEALPVVQVQLTRGLNFVGVPVFPTQEHPLDVFGADSRVARWDPGLGQNGGYVVARQGVLPEVLRVEPGRGFWVAVDANRTVDVPGRPVSPDAALDVPVFAGWNMLANPLGQPMPWTALGITEGMPVRNFGFIYDKQNNQYVMVSSVVGQGIVDTVPTNAAFWLYALARTTLHIHGGTAAAAEPRQLKLSGADFLIPVAASAGDSRDGAVLIGVLTGREIQVENPPAFEGMVDLYVDSASGPMAADVKNQAAASMSWKLTVIAPAGAEQVAIELPDLSRVPADKQVILRDLDTGRATYMRTQPRCVVSTAGSRVRHLELVIEDKRDNCLTVSSAQARQEGSRAVVTFGLSAPARVRAEVVNMAGRLVRTLAADRMLPAGVNSMAWDLRNSQGAAVPAGRYLIRIIAVADNGQQVAAVAAVTVRR